MPVRIEDPRRAQLPPAELIPIKAVRDAVERYNITSQQATIAAQEVAKITAEGRDVAARDRDLYADAIEAGKGDPGTPHADAHREKVEAAQRHADAQGTVRDRAFAALADALEEHAAELEAATETQLATDRADLLDAVDTIAAKTRAVAEAKALHAWATGRSRRFNASARAGSVAMRRSSSSAIPVDKLVDALREFAEPSDDERSEAPLFSGGFNASHDR